MAQQQNEQSPQCKKIEDYTHFHPYEYLTNLNKIYSGYNRSTVKDFSSASKIKLPFYKFSAIKVPAVFEKSYAKEKKELVNYNSVEGNRWEDNQKKLWKQHREIIQKYLDEKENKRVKVPKHKNKEFVEKINSKDRNNIFLKKIIEKGTKFEYDEKKLQQEVIEKLKNIKHGKKKSGARCQTAKCAITQAFGPKIEVNYVEQEQKVKENDYLQFDNEKELVLKYKGLIKKVDCSISEKNITKTCELLHHMRKTVDQNNYL